MTSAHRPTWTAALGGGGTRDGSTSAPTHRYSARDLTSHSKLKLRQPGQDAPGEVEQRNLKQELLQITNKPSISDESKDSDSEVSIPTDSESESEIDETEALLRELEKLKKERELEKQKAKETEILMGNPLMNKNQSKRKWTDETVFKNQQRNFDNEDIQTKRFINDTIRNDFHRKFMERYIK